MGTMSPLIFLKTVMIDSVNASFIFQAKLMNYKRITIILFSSLVIASCGGGGGGGGSSSAASPVSYSYDKTTSDFTSKIWQADAVTRRDRSASMFFLLFLFYSFISFLFMLVIKRNSQIVESEAMKP